MDAKQRIKHLSEAAFGPPFAGSFTDYATALKIPLGDLVASGIDSCAFCRNPKHPGPCAGPGHEKGPSAAPGGGAHAAHASPGEKRAADRMNGGASLSMKDPEQAEIQGAITDWAEGGTAYTKLHSEMRHASEDPGAQTRGAKLMRTIAASEPSSPALHRGIYDVDPAKIPKMGEEMKIGPSSFSRSPKVAKHFADKTRPGGHAVTIKVRPGSRSLRVDRAVHSDYAWEEEHISMGRFRVISHKEHADSKGVIRHEIEVEQVEA